MQPGDRKWIVVLEMWGTVRRVREDERGEPLIELNTEVGEWLARPGELYDTAQAVTTGYRSYPPGPS